MSGRPLLRVVYRKSSFLVQNRRERDLRQDIKSVDIVPHLLILKSGGFHWSYFEQRSPEKNEPLRSVEP